MEFGLDKCQKVSLVRGEVDLQLGHKDQAFIETMTEKDSNKYLGVLQFRGPLQTAMKESLLECFSKRLSSISRTSLNSNNKIKAVSTYVISLLTYSFGLIKWTDADLEDINTIIRTELTGHRMHNRSSAIERMVLPRLNGGRCVLEVYQQCASQVSQLHEYFYKKQHVALYNNICREDNGYTPLHLAGPNCLKTRHHAPERELQRFNGDSNACSSSFCGITSSARVAAVLMVEMSLNKHPFYLNFHFGNGAKSLDHDIRIEYDGFWPSDASKFGDNMHQ